MKTIGNMNQVRAALLLRGWHSVSSWAVATGYEPVTVRQVVHRWGMRPERPHGGISREVMRDLRVMIASEIAT